jgi:hypothetical protein
MQMLNRALRSIAPETPTSNAPRAKIDVLHLYHKHIVINVLAREARNVQFLCRVGLAYN